METVKKHVVCLPGTWFMSTAERPEISRLIFGPMLAQMGFEEPVVHFPPYEGNSIKSRARSALDALYVEFGSTDLPLMIPLCWSAGLHVARRMEEMHGRRLWSAIGNVAGLSRYGVEYPEFFGMLRSRFWIILKGLATNRLIWPKDAVLWDILRTSNDFMVPNELRWTLDVSLQVAETLAYVASIYFPLWKEIMAPPALQGPLVTLLGGYDCFVGPNTSYSGEREVWRKVISDAPHGALLLVGDRPQWQKAFQEFWEQLFLHDRAETST